MPWTDPFTAQPGQMMTAAIWNQGVRDNLNLLKTSISDTGTLKTLLDKNTDQVDLIGSAAETNLYYVAVPGGTLSTNSVLRLTLTGSINLTATSETFHLRVYFGGILIAGGPIITTAGCIGGVLLTTLINENGAIQNAQRAVSTVQHVADNVSIGPAAWGGPATVRTAYHEGLTLDSTIAQPLQVNAQWASGYGTSKFSKYLGMLEVLRT